MDLLNRILSHYLRARYRRVAYFSTHPESDQRRILSYLLQKGRQTLFGTEHHLDAAPRRLRFRASRPRAAPTKTFFPT